MLNIQKASAGSGKTYTLAKKYILNLIAYQKADDSYSLRNDRQIEDALQHILAITFTNKATNEMKQRIVANLSLLARAENAELTPEFLKQTPYLEEFKQITGASYKEIGHVSAVALKMLLNNFSNFKISTIDSFFQEILRTFTFEANVNEAYQVEIDSEFINDSALEAAIHELDSHPENMGNATKWLKIIMSKEASKSRMWNPFNRNNAKGSVYFKLNSVLNQLEKEEFKDVKQILDSYFEDPSKIDALLTLYYSLKDQAKKEREDLVTQIANAKVEVEAKIAEFNISPDQLYSGFLKILTPADITKAKAADIKPRDLSEDKGVIKKNGALLPDQVNIVNIAAMKMVRLVEKWKYPEASSIYKSWLVYGELIPYLGLIIEIKKFISDVLKTNNLIQLSETGYILRKIIGNSDAPFVYERLGNRIDHYLIDEFQDTSRIQWDVIFPLLSEGLAKNKDSLIIGDPKQSIYRFRNADHRLITDVVPKAFPHHHESGLSKEENTNWRSHTNIVAFNNLLFKNLAFELTKLSSNIGKGIDLTKLYSNVVQYPNNQKGKGYVEIRFLEKPSEDEDMESSKTDSEKWFNMVAAASVPPLVYSLMERGYKFKDIGILVNKNENGKRVIDEIIRFNHELPEGKPKIKFISEESLLISSAPCVQTVIGVLTKLANPGNYRTSEPSDDHPQKYYNWNRIHTDFEIFARQNPHMDVAQRLLTFLNLNEFSLAIPSLLEDLPVPSLAAIVEAIIASFLSEEQRKKDAIFLASFQDIVNEYSSNHSQDPASFLEWWKAKGKNSSVTSPDGIDAVNIMTVHKSKGLEFKCVIVPFATKSFDPQYMMDEWRWVKPVSIDGLDLPPVLPVLTTLLNDSAHDDIYREFIDQNITDNLNNYYVAFTRAKNELYIFTKKITPRTPVRSFHKILHDLLVKGEIPDKVTEDEICWMLSPEKINVTDHLSIITVGSPFTGDEIALEYLKEAEKAALQPSPRIHIFSDYEISYKRPNLRVKAFSLLPSGETGEQC